ncbi:HD-GYP domain-containing protein [Clostridium estertheticum]|uniref:HD-GYP domain-containing protein n=1 Tax=Clostridium estertheticum TaxID=238834 RepID=UPI001CF5C27E|nr:HD-GYP domain-containing protein [Clostridium estertheticum]MCB2305981.1 HD-GYP domain-containing protein [Clostridium estertheticum]MCB2345550.1 HD-GYP domain-containing protein [Clostridium estertheticum]MCB2349047.1 HD-GYP domain-containing protein [Clostridium estertheticum]WAG47686.1 HD-GYP domain-containing protein [Clostridium estertheticum]
MRLEFINRVKVNEILGKNIVTNDGSILLRSGVELNKKYIVKLKRLGVFYIYVEDSRLDDVSIEDERLSSLKELTMKNMSTIMKNVTEGDIKGTKNSLSVVEDLVNYIIEMGDVSKSLYDIQTFDNYTYLHSIDTGIMAIFLGITMNLSQGELKELSIGAILHDIGKTKIDKNIITKPGKLTKEEFEEIKNHPIYGKEILMQNFSMTNRILKAVEHHHERVDGNGYPYGLTKNQISKFAKIIGICDVYDSVSNDRCYRKKFNPSDAYELILAGAGNAFDEEVVKDFKKTFSVFPLGVCLKLSNGVEGYVIKQNKNFPDRPIVRVLYESETRLPIKFYEIDLLKHHNVIVEAIM